MVCGKISFWLIIFPARNLHLVREKIQLAMFDYRRLQYYFHHIKRRYQEYNYLTPNINIGCFWWMGYDGFTAVATGNGCPYEAVVQYGTDYIPLELLQNVGKYPHDL